MTTLTHCKGHDILPEQQSLSPESLECKWGELAAQKDLQHKTPTNLVSSTKVPSMFEISWTHLAWKRDIGSMTELVYLAISLSIFLTVCVCVCVSISFSLHLMLPHDISQARKSNERRKLVPPGVVCFNRESYTFNVRIFYLWVILMHNLVGYHKSRHAGTSPRWMDLYQ